MSHTALMGTTSLLSVGLTKTRSRDEHWQKTHHAKVIRKVLAIVCESSNELGISLTFGFSLACIA